jgi:uncharacterized protein YbbC (DUF1343 family)
MILQGIDVLQQNNFAPLIGKRIGLFTNFCSVNRDLLPTHIVLANIPNVNLVAMFAPEHGIFGAEAEGKKIDTTRDRAFDVPVYSLYGETMRPMPEMLKNIDIMVCDIADIGVRYYTFRWTLSHILEACGEFGLPVLILDRPNPLGGDIIEGSPLNAGFSSLIGRFDVPIRHGMTFGESALYINTFFNPTPATVEIVKCAGLKRYMNFWDFQLPWIPPSPNMGHFITAEHYPGSCFIEGTNISEGRGTTTPFEIFGAPYMDAIVLADYLNLLDLKGVRFRPHTFKPQASKYTGQLCYGVHAHLTDVHTYRPIEVWLNILREIRQIYAEQFEWSPMYNNRYHFDLLVGNDVTRKQIDDNLSVPEMMSGWDVYCNEFREKRKPFLLYD